MAHALLVSVDELPLFGVADDFLSDFSSQLLEANLQAVTDEALSRMAPAVVPPLLAWGSDIKAACARIAAYEIKSVAGLAPTNVAVGDENLLLRAQAAREWLTAVGRGEVHPQGLEDSSTDGTAGGEIIDSLSDTRREW